MTDDPTGGALDTWSGHPRVHTIELSKAVDACLRAEQAATACADACLAERDVTAMRACIANDIQTAELCVATARTLGRRHTADHFVTQRLLQACIRACTLSAAECERHAGEHPHCELCAHACGECAKACEPLLDERLLEELREIAGR
jgi:hypothetical protein